MSIARPRPHDGVIIIKGDFIVNLLLLNIANILFPLQTIPTEGGAIHSNMDVDANIRATQLMKGTCSSLFNSQPMMIMTMTVCCLIDSTYMYLT